MNQLAPFEEGIAKLDPVDASGNARRRRPKALALLSGGLDSMLAVKLLLDQGVDVEAVNFATPFCLCDRCSLGRFANDLAIKVHRIFLGKEFLNIVVNPPHGHGSGMNPCIDCRILMFKKARGLAEKIGADFIVTGEVLNERPFSQRRGTMLHIEREAGLGGKVLRPLSAKLLPESEPEKNGLINRDELLAIKGRRRIPQIRLARELNMEDYPCPAGGCLLTDPRFSERLKEHLKHEKKLTPRDVSLLKVGRHFRLGKARIVVGRNEEENRRILSIVKRQGLSHLEAVNYKGPITLFVGEERPDTLEKAAAITMRYSDAPKNVSGKVICKCHGEEKTIEVKAMTDDELEGLRI